MLTDPADTPRIRPLEIDSRGSCNRHLFYPAFLVAADGLVVKDFVEMIGMRTVNLIRTRRGLGILHSSEEAEKTPPGA